MSRAGRRRPQGWLSSEERHELVGPRRENRVQGMEIEILKRASAYFARENVLLNGVPAGPVHELAADGFDVAVTCVVASACRVRGGVVRGARRGLGAARSVKSSSRAVRTSSTTSEPEGETAVRVMEVAKGLAALAGHGRTFRRRLPEDLGGAWFPASLEGGTKFLRSDLHLADPPLTGFAVKYVRAGMRVWDVGANVGLFTFTAAGLGAEVLAIEADIWLVGNLRRAAALQDLKVSVLSAAAAADWGIADFVVAANTRATSYLASFGGSVMTGGVRERHHVATVPLDTLIEKFGIPDVVKVDVEGAEVAVLAGAAQVLSTGPVLLIEVYERNKQAAHDLLSMHGYRYIDAATGREVSLPAYNTVALPSGARQRARDEDLQRHWADPRSDPR